MTLSQVHTAKPKQNNVIHWSGYDWWPERGRIHWQDPNTGHYGQMSVQDCLERLKALNDMVATTQGADPTEVFYRDQIASHRWYIDQMLKLCKIARKQGDPMTDAGVQKAKDRQPRTFVNPKAGMRTF